MKTNKTINRRAIYHEKCITYYDTFVEIGLRS